MSIEQKSGTFQYADSFSSEKLNVELIEGKKFIEIYGNKYELQMNRNQQYNIITELNSGIKKHIPVYMEPLSKTWHLKTHNEKRVFSNVKKEIIDRLKVMPEKDRRYFESSLNKGIFEVRDANKDISTEHALYSVVEINGSLVPVKTDVVPERGIKYKLYNRKNPHGKKYLIELDGNRWIFEMASSPNVSKSLEKAVKYGINKKLYNRYVNIDSSQL